MTANTASSSSTLPSISPDHFNGKDKNNRAFSFHSYISNQQQHQQGGGGRITCRMNRIVILCGLSLVVLWLVMEEHYQNNNNNTATTTNIGSNGNGNGNGYSFYQSSSSSLSSLNDSLSGGLAVEKRTLSNHQQPAQAQQAAQASPQTQQQQAQAEAPAKHRPIRQISILGERNSGTRWTYDHIQECFGHAVAVEKRLSRYKHWFQTPTLSHNYPHDTLVLAQFRNPYDWLKAMERVPHHAPAHLRTKLNSNVSSQTSENDWRIFLSKPWTMNGHARIGLDLQVLQNNTTETAKCQEEFAFRDINSCHVEPLPHEHYNYTLRYSEHQPFYEMRNDGSGIPFDDILQMRTAKIRNFLATKTYPSVADTWLIQYEYLLTKGTRHLLDRISTWTGLTPNCTHKEAQLRKPKKSRVLETAMAAHIRRHLNWTVERWIGYDMELSREDDNGIAVHNQTASSAASATTAAAASAALW